MECKEKTCYKISNAWRWKVDFAFKELQVPRKERLSEAIHTPLSTRKVVPLNLSNSFFKMPYTDHLLGYETANVNDLRMRAR